MTEGVQDFLEEIGLLQYYDMFVIKGFDSEDDLRHVDDKDLDSMYITDLDHRKLILEAASQFEPSNKYKVYEWLKQNGLDHYFPSFIEGDYQSLDEISRLDLPDEDLYDELEITLPGHKRRLERAVNKLRKRHRSILPTTTELPVAVGRWGKPKCLEDAKFDFLVLDATVISTNNAAKFHTFEFMIDSGSDVVTVRDDILQTLDLELLGQIHSKGVHGSKKTNLYKATLRIGTQEMEIEVMGETYNSLGSRVVRNFRHYIDGHRHVWLKGNYKDSYMAVREACSDLKALPPIHSSHPNSFLPISSAPVTETKSGETLMKPKPLPAKPQVMNGLSTNNVNKQDNEVSRNIDDLSDTNISKLTREDTIEVSESVVIDTS